MAGAAAVGVVAEVVKVFFLDRVVEQIIEAWVVHEEEIFNVFSQDKGNFVDGAEPRNIARLSWGSLTWVWRRRSPTCWRLFEEFRAFSPCSRSSHWKSWTSCVQSWRLLEEVHGRGCTVRTWKFGHYFHDLFIWRYGGGSEQVFTANAVFFGLPDVRPLVLRVIPSSFSEDVDINTLSE